MNKHTNKPMTKQEWFEYLEKTWDAAQKDAWAEHPKREWQGLTDEEIDTWNIVGHESLREFVRAIEAKLKEKNNIS